MRSWNWKLAALIAVCGFGLVSQAWAQNSVTVPLDQNPDGSGFSNFVTVSVGGGPASEVLLDTGSTGMRVLASQIGPNVTVTNIPVTYGYSSGNELDGYLGFAPVSFPDASAPLATPGPIAIQVVDQVACKGGGSDCPGWQAGQSGVMGVAYDDDQIFNPLAQLAGNLGSGFIVVSNDLSNPNATPELVVGLTASNMQGFVFDQMATTPGGSQPAGLNVWNTKSIYTCFSVNGGSPGCYATVFDTGANAGSFETPDSPQSGDVANGSLVTISVPDVMSLSVTAQGQPWANLFKYEPPHGGTAGYNSGAEVYRYEAVMFDAQTGQIGFSPIVNWIFGTVEPANDAALGTPGAAIALGGTLEMPNGFSSDRAIYLISDAALQADGSATLSGTLTGSDNLTILGPGTLDLTGSSLYSGTAEVQGGATLLVNGVLPASILLDSGTALGGNGMVANLAAASGSIVAPGNSTATLQVVNGLAMAPGAEYEIQLGAPGSSTLISVGGQAMLGGTVAASLAPGFVPRGGANYTILTAAGGVTGNFNPTVATGGLFGTAAATYPFLLPQLSTSANTVTLTLARSSVKFTSAGGTPNEIATATGADGTSLANGLVDALAGLNDGSLPAALNAASGQVYASVQSLLQQRSADLRDATTARLNQAQAATDGADPQDGQINAASLSASAPDKATLWTEAFGRGDHFGGNENAAGLSSSGGGFLMGLDSPIGPAWRVGVTGGYGNYGFDSTNVASSGSISSYDTAIYGGARYGAFRLRLGAGYDWDNVSADRNVAFPGFYDHVTGNYTANTAQVYGEVSTQLPFRLVAVEPLADLAYVNVADDGFRESGGAAALTAQSTNFGSTYSTLGALLSKNFDIGRAGTLVASSRLGWQHAFGDVTPVNTFAFSGGGADYTISGVPISRDAAVVAVGLGYRPEPGLALSVYYAGQLAPGVQENNITGAVTVKF
jgi:outer membrane autotransporter protein